MSWFKKIPNAEFVILKFATALGKKINRKELSSELYKHPDYPSMLAVMDVLNFFTIDCVIVKIKTEELDKISLPAIIHTDQGGGTFLLVNDVNFEQVRVCHERRGDRLIPIDNLNQSYTGIAIVLLSQNQQQPVKKYSLFRNWQKKYTHIILCLVTICAITLGFKNSSLNPELVVLLSIKLSGLTFSFSLLMKFYGKSNMISNRFCGAASSGCNALLSSRIAVTLSGISWGEIGCSYFLGTLLLAISSFGSSILPALFLMTLFCLPFTCYLLFYLFSDLRRLCKMCCFVHLSILAELFTELCYSNKINGFSLLLFGNCLLILLLPAIAIRVLIIFYKDRVEIEYLKNDIRRLKYNYQNFKAVLSLQPKIALPEKEISSVMGAKTDDEVITVVLSPTCSACVTLLPILEYWIMFRADIQVRLLILEKTENYNGLRASLLKRPDLIKNDNELLANIRGAFTKSNYYKNIKEEGRHVFLEDEIVDKIKSQDSWLKTLTIDKTPAIFVNGFRLPPGYNANEITYLISGS